MKTEMLRRTLHPETRVIDEKMGVVEYVASDESVDSYREVIRANGWRFDRFERNAPFVDSHNYGSIESLVGRVVDFKVAGKQLVETVKWAVDVPENKLAQIGWAMTKAGYLKAVSVGFIPEDYVTKWDADSAQYKPVWEDQLKDLGMDADTAPRCIYIRQQQLELSACIIGANMNALAKAHKAGVIGEVEVDLISVERSKRETAGMASDSAAAMLARQRKRAVFLEEFERITRKV